MSAISFVVYGVAQTQGNLARGRFGGVYEKNKRLAPWRDNVAQAAGPKMAGRTLLDGPVRLSVRFVLPRPNTHFTGKGILSAEGRRHPYPDRNPDLDKLERAVADALTAVVYTDDARIVQKESTKVYGEPARCEVRVEPAFPTTPYGGEAKERIERLDGAIPTETASNFDREDQLRSVLRMVDHAERCPCGEPYDPLARLCRCGRATFSPYVQAASG